MQPLTDSTEECVESERHLGGNQNQGIPSCHSYHPLLWLWNVDNLSMAYKEAKPLLHDLSEEDSWNHMAKTHPRHWSFNSGFSSHPDAITASLGWSCCLHERSPPPKETALQWTVSGQALPRRPEKALQRHIWRSPWNLSALPLIAWNIWRKTDKWHKVIKRGGKLCETRKNSNWAAWETYKRHCHISHCHHHSLFSLPKTLPCTDWSH